MVESTRNHDKKQEEILSDFLFQGYQNTPMKGNIEKVNDKNEQLDGIDLKYHKQSGSYNIDEKAQLTYINKSLPTFAFEISSFQGKNSDYLSEGWLFAQNKTDYYFLITEIFLTKQAIVSQLQQKNISNEDIEYYINNYKNKASLVKEWQNRNNPNYRARLNFKFQLFTYEDIDSCLVTCVKKSELLQYLSRVQINIIENDYNIALDDVNGKGITKETCRIIDNALRNHIKENKIKKGVIKQKVASGIYLHCTNFLAEKPVNLVIKLQDLLHNLNNCKQRKFYRENGVVKAGYLS